MELFFFFFRVVLLLALILCCGNAGPVPFSPLPSPTSAPSLLPTKTTPPPHVSPTPVPISSSASTLDPKQLSALQSMNLPTTSDPCKLPTPYNFTVCDDSSPFRHVIALTLVNCSSDLDLSPTTFRSLSSTLVSLSFLHCRVPPPSRLPSTRLLSFSSVSSFRRLTGVYLGRLANLTDLTVVDVPISASGVSIILSQMRGLRSVTISNTTLSGEMPRKWKCLNVRHVDLSGNKIRGAIHASIGTLSAVEFLDLSKNSLTGDIPDTIVNMVGLKNVSFAHNSMSGTLPKTMVELSELVHLDLSNNQFNGSLPSFLTEMKRLKFLNLENNNFHGILPFNSSFIKRLDVLRLSGNSNLCYNRTLLSFSKLKLGIARCDRFGLPVTPPPERASLSSGSDTSESEDGGGSEDDGGEEGHHGGPSKIVLVVAIGLSCLVFLIIFLVCLSKMCG